MKIIGINASPRGEKSNTGRLVKGVLDGAGRKGADCEYIDLCSLDIEYCTGCTTCYSTGECVLVDDAADVIASMIEADGIVLGSPNYIDSVTGQMKTYLDRLADLIHCQLLTGKYACAVCTAGGSGADEVVTYLNSVLFKMGATVVGGVGEVIGGNPEALEGAVAESVRLGGILADAVTSRMADPVQDKAHNELEKHFRALCEKNKDYWKHEYEYWQALEPSGD